MPIPDRFNPRIWLRNIIVRVNRWLWKMTPAERAELARNKGHFIHRDEADRAADACLTAWRLAA